MKKILQDSTAYQALVDQFEEKRRKHRNKFTKIEDVIRDEESKLSKQKGVLSKEVFANKIKDDERSDRVIATKWDAAFTLFDGIPSKEDIDRLYDNVPKQETCPVN